jgi:hypothetical protein
MFLLERVFAAATQITPGLPGPLDPSDGNLGILAFIQNAYLFSLGAAGLLALGSVAYGAVTYTLSRGNPSQLADAWDRIVQALVGVLLLVGAGAILSVVNPGLTSLNLPSLAKLAGPRYDPIDLTGKITNPSSSEWGLSDKPVKGGTGKCEVISSAFSDNPCTIEKLAGTCFGQLGDATVRQASRVCNAESSANPVNYNKGYTCEGGQPVVAGLFQINLKAHRLQTPNGTLNCPDAFRAGGGPAKCKVTNTTLYTSCFAAARTAAVSTEMACKLYSRQKKSNKWYDWEVSHCTPKRFACCGIM